MKISREQCVAILIDVQERLFPHIYQHHELEQNLVRLIQGLKILNVPIIVTQQYTRGLGETIPPIKEILDPFQPIEKLTFSCCGVPAVWDHLGTMEERRYVILFGIETHVCVLQTALDLIREDFVPVIVEDCVSSRRLNDKQVALRRMEAVGCILTTSESLLFELLGKAGTDTFKAISRLVK